MRRYKLIDHTADIGIVAFGKDLPETFANSAYAMFDILTDVSKVEGNESFELQVSAHNQDELLITWLDELLFRYETERIVCNCFVINSLDEKNLTATVFYEKINYKKHEIKTEIKNVTYHQLEIKKVRSGWSAQVIFDV
ncbi:MAG: protein archease [Candidatus Poribacteria bacterium]|nr:protein archease [Candidatus Poribacteria bacterium]